MHRPESCNLRPKITNQTSRDDLRESKITPKLPVGNVQAESKINYIYKRDGALVWTK